MNRLMRTGIVHVHTDWSHDGRDSLERLRELSLDRGIRFVALTDHAEDLSRDRFAEYQRRCVALSDDRITLVPGLEFRFAGLAGMHLLALGLRSWIEPRTPEEFVAMTRTTAGFTIMAHPVLARYRVPDAVRAGIDAIEVWNASYNTRYLPDPRAIALVHEFRRERPSVVGIAGLDQHDAANDRETRVLVDDEGDPIAALREGRFVNVGRTMRFGPAIEWSPLRHGSICAARWVFDRVERTQERVARTLRGSA